MRRFLFIILLAAATYGRAQAQSFDKYKKRIQAEFNQYKSDREREFKEYRDRINAEFEEYMCKAWPTYKSQPAEPVPSLRPR